MGRFSISVQMFASKKPSICDICLRPLEKYKTLVQQIPDEILSGQKLLTGKFTTNARYTEGIFTELMFYPFCVE